jgi:hypothetical protein
MEFSRAFGLDKTQAELDFVDVDLERDAPLFVDPFAISQLLLNYKGADFVGHKYGPDSSELRVTPARWTVT